MNDTKRKKKYLKKYAERIHTKRLYRTKDNIPTYGQYLQKEYNTTRTQHVTRQAKKAGLSDADLARFRRKR